MLIRVLIKTLNYDNVAIFWRAMTHMGKVIPPLLFIVSVLCTLRYPHVRERSLCWQTLHTFINLLLFFGLQIWLCPSSDTMNYFRALCGITAQLHTFVFVAGHCDEHRGDSFLFCCMLHMLISKMVCICKYGEKKATNTQLLEGIIYIGVQWHHCFYV